MLISIFLIKIQLILYFPFFHSFQFTNYSEMTKGWLVANLLDASCRFAITYTRNLIDQNWHWRCSASIKQQRDGHKKMSIMNNGNFMLTYKKNTLSLRVTPVLWIYNVAASGHSVYWVGFWNKNKKGKQSPKTKEKTFAKKQKRYSKSNVVTVIELKKVSILL